MPTSAKINLVVLWIAALVTLSGCRPNPLYCEDHVLHNCELPPDSVDGQSGCISNEQCTAPAVCNTATSVCVQCTADQPAACKGATPVCGAENTCVQCTAAQPGACIGVTPICNAESNQCEKCTAHAQCATSSVCLPDGACADPTTVAYVQERGSGGAAGGCSLASPCGTLADAIQTNRPFIKIAAGTIADNKLTTIDGKSVTILADAGAKLDRTNDGTLLEVRNNGADVRIFDLEITGGTGMATDAAISIPAGGSPRLTLTRVRVEHNQGVGILVSSGTLTLSQCTVSHNDGGGISISSAQFDIANNFIVENGGSGATLGGVKVDAIGVNAPPPHRIDFNTIAANLGPGGVNLGISCGTVLTLLTFSNNIVYGNIVSGGGAQVGNGVNCATSYSDIGPDGMTGTGNINADPLFVSVTNSNFHLTSASMAKDKADPAATLGVDVDGDIRPQGQHSDMGADEVKQ
jgi:hypothetical protein